jgi:UDP-N-acetylmuramoyl-L-alanyl-D-glutamate--2,6-diaminopimelate ligase
VENLLATSGALLAAGVDAAALPDLLRRLVPPAGRMQRVGGVEEPLAVIDYAHTPDAIAKVLAALRPLAAARGGHLVIAFGAGGDRDPGKRAPMGEAAAAGADRLIVTSDNPRTEDPEAIIDAIVAAIPAGKPLARVADRAQAIAQAVGRADAKDVVLIAGKGHEDYQDIGGRKLPFSDLREARQALQARRLRLAAAGDGR